MCAKTGPAFACSELRVLRAMEIYEVLRFWGIDKKMFQVSRFENKFGCPTLSPKLGEKGGHHRRHGY